jgi:hypothetical protein
MASRKSRREQSAQPTLSGVLNADSIKGNVQIADEKSAEQTLSNLAKYPDLHIVVDHGVLALVDERKRAVVCKCKTCHTPFLLRTSDAFQVKGRCPKCRKPSRSAKTDEPKAKGRRGSRKARKGGAR